MTDGQGRTVDFRNTIIIMTSNVGAESLFKNLTMGFQRVADEADNYEKMKDRVMEQMKHTFRPEFLNRIDEIIVFHSLSDAELRKIINLLLQELSQRIKENGFELEISATAQDLIMKEGYDPNYGARPLKRAIQKMIEDTVSEEILKKAVLPGDTILVDAEDNKIVVRRQTPVS